MSVLLAHQWYGPVDSLWLYVMAPGDCGELGDVAGTVVAQALAVQGVRVVRFAAPVDGTDNDWEAAITAFVGTRSGSQRLLLGGQSRGARVSVGLAAPLGADALLLWSYPFHPRRSPTEVTGLARLNACTAPVWLCQGSRDAMGNREQVRGYDLGGHINVHWMEDANHNLVPRKRSGLQQEALLRHAVEVVADDMLKS